MRFWLRVLGPFAAAAAGFAVASWLLKTRTQYLESSFQKKLDEMKPTMLAISGRRLSLDEVNEQEQLVSENPSNLRARCLLLGFYNRADRSAVEAKKYQEHALWVIEHKPEHPIAKECELLSDSYSESAYQQGKRLWLRHLKRQGRDTAILRHAANYFLLEDGALAEQLLLAGKELQPNNPEWSEQLAHLYDLGIDGIKHTELAAKALEHQERAYSLCQSGSAFDRLRRLESLPEKAFNAGQFEKASTYAQWLLSETIGGGLPDHFGNAGDDFRHKGHSVLGRIAVRNGDIEAAKSHLHSSADLTGSPVLNSFGPSMLLAKALLEKEETEAVLKYLDRCAMFWHSDRGRISDWRKEIAAGTIPSDWHR